MMTTSRSESAPTSCCQRALAIIQPDHPAIIQSDSQQSTNKRFAEWPQVFPNAACVVTLVDRLLHRCECIDIDADSYRFKEAQEREAARDKARSARRKKTNGSRASQTSASDKEPAP